MTAQYQLQLTTITPVCIGTGTKLSPYADYVIDERHKKIYYIDQELVKRKLAQNVRLVDDYVAGVATGMDNNRSSFNVDQFLRTRLGIDVKTQHRLQLDCEATGSKELYTIVKNAGRQPYIPGSSLKGAVKTALLYDWLINSEEGKGITNRLLKNFYDKEANNKLAHILEKNNPGFSDSALVDSSRLKCIDVKRLHIKKGTKGIPQTWESIVAGTKAIVSFADTRYGTYNPSDWKRLHQVINQYALAGNKCEWDILCDISEKNKKMSGNDNNRLCDFYEKMNENIQGSNEKTIFLKLGSGKGYYLNSVGLAIFDADPSEGKTAFLNFLKQGGFGKVYKKETRRTENYELDPYDFPITRVVDAKHMQPLGWIKLELVK